MIIMVLGSYELGFFNLLIHSVYRYRKLKVADINSVFSKHKYNLTLTCRALDRWKGTFLKSRRSQVEYDIIKKDGGKGIDLPFLQEVSGNTRGSTKF